MTTEYPYEHQSPSQVQMYEKCGRMYMYRYIEKKKYPPGVAANIGTGAHKGREAGMRKRLVEGKLAPLEEAQDIARDTIIGAFKEGDVTLTPEEASEGRKNVRDTALDTVMKLVAADYDKILPFVLPLAVEQRIEWQPKGYPLKILGVLDLVDGQYGPDTAFPRDEKTGAKKAPVEFALQLITYDMLWEAHTGTRPGAVIVDHVQMKRYKKQTVRNIDHVEVSRSVFTVDDAARKRVLNRYAYMRESVGKGVFAPNPHGWWCSKKWCGYHKVCPFFSGRE